MLHKIAVIEICGLKNAVENRKRNAETSQEYFIVVDRVDSKVLPVGEVSELVALAVDVVGLLSQRAAVLPQKCLFITARVKQARRYCVQLTAFCFLKEVHVVGIRAGYF